MSARRGALSCCHQAARLRDHMPHHMPHNCLYRTPREDWGTGRLLLVQRQRQRGTKARAARGARTEEGERGGTATRRGGGRGHGVWSAAGPLRRPGSMVKAAWPRQADRHRVAAAAATQQQNFRAGDAVAQQCSVFSRLHSTRLVHTKGGGARAWAAILPHPQQRGGAAVKTAAWKDGTDEKIADYHWSPLARFALR